jgi:hypothetical protein
VGDINGRVDIRSANEIVTVSMRSEITTFAGISGAGIKVLTRYLSDASDFIFSVGLERYQADTLKKRPRQRNNRSLQVLQRTNTVRLRS